MDVNLEQLRSFLEVAHLGHFTRAAESLHLAQPSLSRQISTLERDLGSELFHRARGHISLTPAGEALLPLARRMLADADTVRREMAELAGLRSGRVRLGATPSLCVSLVAEAVGTFHAAHPGIDLQLTERGSRDLVDALVGGTLDLALLTSSPTTRPPTDALTRTPLLTEELVVVTAAAGTSTPSGDTITLESLAGLPQIAFPLSYDLRATADAAFLEAGLSPSVVLEGAEMDSALRLVENGLGVAIVPALVLLDRPALRSVRLTNPRLTRTISLARRSDAPPTLAARTMHQTIVATADALAGRVPTISKLVAHG